MNPVIFHMAMFAFAFEADGNIDQGRVVGKFIDSETCQHAIVEAEAIIQQPLEKGWTARAFCVGTRQEDIKQERVAPPGGAVL
jgi:hypothetical protein